MDNGKCYSTKELPLRDMNPAELKNTYDKIAKDYFDDHQKDDWDDDFVELFSKKLFTKAKVLDLGCGPGVETKKLSEKGFELYGFDLSDELLKIASQQVPTAHFVQGNMLEKFPYEDGCFDGVFAKASLLHIPKEKITNVFGEIIRVLKSGGIFHLAVKRGNTEKEVSESDYGYEYKRFFSYWEPDELQQLFQEYGLTLLEEGSWTNPGKKTVWLKYLLFKQ